MRAVRGGEIAMIFQEPMTALNPLHTIGAQIAEVLTLHQGLDRRAARARAVALLERTGIAEAARRIDAYPHQLSGGQRQRAMIAMALAGRPRLLIADEPTTALDVTIQAQILALLDELQAETGMALLFITHDLNLVRRFTDRVGVMERGKLVEIGATADVFAAPQHPLHAVAAREPAEARGRADRRRRADAARGARPARELRGRGHVVSPAQHRRRALGDARAAPRRDARHRRRIGLGQDDAGDGAARARAGRRRLGVARRRARRPRRSRGLRAMRKRMQVVFQDPFGSLSPRMTIGRIVGEGLALHRPELGAAARKALVAQMLAEVGLAGSAPIPTSCCAAIRTSSRAASASASRSRAP